MDIHTLIAIGRDHYKKLPSQSQTTLKILISILGIFISILLIKACVSNSQQKKNHPPHLLRENDLIKIPEGSPLRTKIQINPVQTSNAPHTVVFPGVVEAEDRKTVKILPPMPGRLISLHAELGERVKKGQTLAILQSAAMAQAQADLIKAQSILNQAKEALQRAQKVNRAGGNAIKDIEQNQNNYNQALAESQRAQVTLDYLGANKENQMQIQAPVDGIIIELNYGDGSYLNDINIPLYVLANVSPIWVTACVPESLIASVAVGQKVSIVVPAYPKQKWEAKISFVNPLIDPNTRCSQTHIALENTDEKLQPNMFASIHVQIPQSEQITVPLSTLLMINDTISVYLEVDPWVFKRHAVILGPEDNNQVRIMSGLKPGDRVVTNGGILLND